LKDHYPRPTVAYRFIDNVVFWRHFP
jgi:hypothetical protein